MGVIAPSSAVAAAHEAVARAEARLCECDRPDEGDNPHRHEKDMGCVFWLAGGKPNRRKIYAACVELGLV